MLKGEAGPVGPAGPGGARGAPVSTHSTMLSAYKFQQTPILFSVFLLL